MLSVDFNHTLVLLGYAKCQLLQYLCSAAQCTLRGGSGDSVKRSPLFFSLQKHGCLNIY